MSIEQHLKIKIKQLEKTNYMSKKNSYIGISFVILIFGIYVVRNLDDRITNQTIIAVSYTHLTLPTTPYV